VLDGAVRQALQGVEPGQADRGLVAAELVGGLGVQLGDSPFGGVVLGVHQGEFGGALPASGQQQRDRAPGADHECSGGADRVQLNARPGAAVAVPQDDPGEHCDGEHDHRAQRDRPVR
jgi:hypothetical protein